MFKSLIFEGQDDVSAVAVRQGMPLRGQVAVLGSQGSLANVLTAEREKIICCASPKTKEEAAQLSVILGGAPRVMHTQLCAFDWEWDEVDALHRLMGHPVVSYPTEMLYHQSVRERAKGYSLRDLSHLARLAAAAGLATYGAWLGERFEEEIEQFDQKDTLLYELEWRLKDFVHEVRSANIKKFSEPFGKEALSALGELEGKLMVQAHMLQEVEEAVVKLHSPKFLSLQRAAAACRTLLTGAVCWADAMAMMQLLNEYCGAVSVISCATGLERTQFAFALRLALARQEHPDILVNLRRYSGPLCGLNPADVRSKALPGMVVNQDLLACLPSPLLVYDEGKAVGLTADGIALLKELNLLGE